MSSCRKPEIQNDLPKITKVKKDFAIFLTNNGQKSVTAFISLCCFNYLIEFLEIGKLKKKKYASKGIRTRYRYIPRFEATEHLCNRMRKENCRKLL